MQLTTPTHKKYILKIHSLIINMMVVLAFALLAAKFWVYAAAQSNAHIITSIQPILSHPLCHQFMEFTWTGNPWYTGQQTMKDGGVLRFRSQTCSGVPSQEHLKLPVKTELLVFRESVEEHRLFCFNFQAYSTPHSIPLNLHCILYSSFYPQLQINDQ